MGLHGRRGPQEKCAGYPFLEDGVIDVAKVAEMEEPEVVEMEEVPSASASAVEKSVCDLLKDFADKSLLKKAQSCRRLAGCGLLKKPPPAWMLCCLGLVAPDPLHYSRSVSVVHFGRCASSFSSCQGFTQKPEDIILEEWTRLLGRK